MEIRRDIDFGLIKTKGKELAVHPSIVRANIGSFL